MQVSDRRQRLAKNVAAVRAHIAAAAARSGRSPDAVRIVGVTKYASPAVVAELPSLGITDLGENRVQQLVERAVAAGPAQVGWPSGPATAEAARPRWHMIGHLQRNKVRQLLPHCRIVHSVDSERLVQVLEQEAARLETASAATEPVRVDVLIEVSVTGEEGKGGVPPAATAPLAAAIAGCRHLLLRGLMTMAPLNPDSEAARPVFARLRELLGTLRSGGVVGPSCEHLSMGMSQDYEVAVQEGATLVRIGSALFEGIESDDPRRT